MDYTNDHAMTGTVQETVQSIADDFGVDHFTLHLFGVGDGVRNKPYVRTNYPDAWVSHYLLHDYVQIDPVLRMAETTAGPFCWSQIPSSDYHPEVMEQAARHGLGQTGFTISHVDSLGRRSVLSFNARMAQGGDTWEPFINAKRADLIQLAAVMHRKALAEINPGKDAMPQLSPRETECLKWTAAGKTHTDIAIILDLSEHTVRGYLKDARQKLDSVSLAHAVSKAASLGLI